MNPPTRSIVVTPGGAALAVWERGDVRPDRPSVVMVHGWPDTHELWDPVADQLADQGLHVVTYDVRGVGESMPAMVHRPFDIEKVAADIGAVVAAVSPHRPVHLVGHDWGGVQGWEFVSTDACLGRVDTFTTISGPNLDQFGALLHRAARRPSSTDLATAMVQVVMSAYTIVLSVPVLRTAMWRLGFARLFRLWLRVTEGIPSRSGYPSADLPEAARAGVPLYRANIWRRLRRPDLRRARVPVHQVVATRDRYISPRALSEAEAWVDDFTRSELDAGHWSVRTHADEITERLTAYFATRERTLV